MFRAIYMAIAFLGLTTTGAAFIMGFLWDPSAPVENLWFNMGIYAAFITVHIIMTMPAFKKALYGKAEGSLGERRIYILVTVFSWLVVYYYHKPVPGPGLDLALWEFGFWVQYLGVAAVLLAVVAFFEFADFAGLRGLIGMPGSEITHTVGGETPLQTEGPYASVRHPMYRAAVLMGLASLIIFPNAGQALFVAMIGGSFLLTIPFEEKQLLKARGDEYGDYMKETPWRVFRGIW